MKYLSGSFACSIVLLLLGAPVSAARECAATTNAAAGPARITVVLEFTLPPGIPRRMAEGAVSEADAIWRRYGVDVVLGDDAGCAALVNAVRLAVVPGAQHAGRTRAPLGAVHFSIEGVPGPVITVFYRDLIEFSGNRAVINAREMEYPEGRREQVAGRVLGRVLAHELGHYLLRWPLHGNSGLMRATQWTPELSSGGDDGFLLSGNEAARLASVLGRTHPH